MKKPTLNDALTYAWIVIVICVILRGWDAIFSFLGIVLTAIIPLLLGAAIAYVVAIPTRFLERHLLPNSKSKVIADLRRPVCLIVTLVLAVMAIVFSSSVLIPALKETVVMVQQNGQKFIEDVIQLQLFDPVRATIKDFLNGEFFQGLKSMDITGVAKSLFGGTVGSVTTHVFTMVSTVMTCFFGMMFSLILLTDTSDVGNQFMYVLSQYLGEERTQRLALCIGVTDSSFHNFIVRQCIEALILGTVGTVVLLLVGFRYALGVGVLLGLAALVPIVGYPVGLLVGAFMVAINSLWMALVYVLCVAVAQVLEATFVLPHVGDPRTAMPPVWITVAVTIGGGVAGFLGMLLAIPLAATIRQLVIIDVRQRFGVPTEFDKYEQKKR